MDTSAVINVNVQSNDTPQAQYKTVVLKPNMVDDVNTLTQAMLDTHGQNTKFVIKYDFTLGEDITVPANCVLEFDGGSISGAYTITGANTGIQAGLVKIFNTNVTLAGTWNVAESYPEWFGAKGDEVTDDRLAIQKTVDAFESIFFSNKSYALKSMTDTTNKICIVVPSYRYINGENGHLDYNNKHIFASGIEPLIVIAIKKETTIANVGISGGVSVEQDLSAIATHTAALASYPGEWSSRIRVINVIATNAYYSMDFRAFLSEFTGCRAGYSYIGFNIHGYIGFSNGTTILARNLSALNCQANGYNITQISYSSFTNCGCDHCGRGYGGNPTFSYAYKFTGINSTSLKSLGCEDIPIGFYMTSSTNITIEEFTSYLPTHPEGDVFVYISRSSNVILQNIKLTSGDTDNKGWLFNHAVFTPYYSYVNIYNFLLEDWESSEATDRTFKTLKAANVINAVGNQIWSNSAWKSIGPTTDRPNIDYVVGLGNTFYDTTLNRLLIRRGDGWATADGAKEYASRSGTFANRPQASYIYVGYAYFATDKGVAGVGAMIYYTGDSTTPWVYADGTAVS